MNPGSEAVARRQVVIVNTYGLHMRPSSKFVKVAGAYQSELRVSYNGAQINGKSLMELMTLAAQCGTTLELEAQGPDAEDLLAALAELVAAGFHMEEGG